MLSRHHIARTHVHLWMKIMTDSVIMVMFIIIMARIQMPIVMACVTMETVTVCRDIMMQMAMDCATITRTVHITVMETAMQIMPLMAHQRIRLAIQIMLQTIQTIHHQAHQAMAPTILKNTMAVGIIDKGFWLVSN